MLIGIDANEANVARRVGINQYAFGLLHALHQLKTPHQFVIYLKSQPLADLPAAKRGWSYRVIPFPKFWTQTRLPFDLYIHRPHPDVFFSLTHYAPRWSPLPTVIAIMDLGFLQSPEQFTPKDFNQLKSWTEYSAKQAKRIITISQFSKNDIIKYYNRSPEDITVTSPGYDQEIFRPTRNPTILKKYGIREPYFFFLGSLKPSKNVEGLIRAFAEFLTQYSSLNPSPKLGEGNQKGGVVLVISGKKAWLYDQIFALVKRLKLGDRVIFTDFVEDKEVPVLMTHAAAFVLPSFFEGFGIPVLEAMACGTPVVVSNVASLPEVAGPAGIFIHPHDPASIAAGLSIAISPQRQKFVAAGLKRVKLFSWANCAQATLSCLQTAWADR